MTTTHLFRGVSGAMLKKFNSHEIGVIIANTLRLMGQGMKVVIEISVMAADAGLVRTDEDIIVIAGSGRGADYAVVLKPVCSNDFFDLKVKEILCKPRFYESCQQSASALSFLGFGVYIRICLEFRI